MTPEEISEKYDSSVIEATLKILEMKGNETRRINTISE